MCEQAQKHTFISAFPASIACQGECVRPGGDRMIFRSPAAAVLPLPLQRLGLDLGFIRSPFISPQRLHPCFSLRRIRTRCWPWSLSPCPPSRGRVPISAPESESQPVLLVSVPSNLLQRPRFCRLPSLQVPSFPHSRQVSVLTSAFWGVLTKLLGPDLTGDIPSPDSCWFSFSLR